MDTASPPPGEVQAEADGPGAAATAGEGRGRLKALARHVGLAGWRLVRPVARPLVWRLRSFLTFPLLSEVQRVQAAQADILRALAELAHAEPRYIEQVRVEQVRVEQVRPIGGATAPTRRVGLRRVHQFHSGSATADAITNSMLLLRTVLRRAGYASEIFVEHVDPDLRDELLGLEALPQDPDYVLIVRHSMGHGAFDRIAALPAAKLLHYHNMTPPELFPDDPAMAAAAVQGRRQLAAWREHVLAATADSPFNALELRALGYDVVLECPLLFDVEALRARAAAAAPARRESAPFTVLFVGRLVESKAQGELMDAFAAFRDRYRGPCRLVLIGRGSEAMAAALRDRADRCGLGEAVELPGVVSDADLDAAYAAADLYVSLSRHEGFGVPLIEAMAHGVPVLAWPAGAVPYTLGGAGCLLADRAPPAVAEAMLALARDPERRAAMAKAGRRRVGDFALDRAWPTLQSALALAGAAPPPPAGVREELEANLHITVAGHFNGSYSLAMVNRTLVQALEEILPGHVGMQVYEAGLPAAFNPQAGTALAAIAARGAPPTGPEVVICQHYPALSPARRGDLALAMQFWEETLLPAGMVAALAEFRGVLAPSSTVGKALTDSGLPVPVFTVGFAPDLTVHAAIGAARLSAPPAAPERLTFLHVSSGFPRKGVDALLAAWAMAFRAGEPVRLVIKVFPNPHNDIAARLATLRAADPGLAEVELIDCDIDDAAMAELYRRADAMVLPTRGEGFNIPAVEAIAAGLAVIVTGWGAHMDFLDADSARLVDFTLAASRSHLTSPHSQWAEPDVEDLARALQETATALRSDPDGCARRAAVVRQRVLARLDRRAWAERVRAAAVRLLMLPPPVPLRLAWISSWNVACGVAEYSRMLLDHFVGSPLFGEAGPVVLCDARHQTPIASPALALRASPCWELGGTGGGFDPLLAELRAEDPDIVMIQHQAGLFDWPLLAALLRAPALAGRIVVVTLHNTMHIEAMEPAVRQEVVQALARADRLVVHSSADVARMRAFGLLDRTMLLPQGALEARPARQLRDLPSTVAPVVGSFGFFLPGKGIPALLAAAARLREEWPALRVRLVNARYPQPVSDREIAECRALADRLNLTAAVEWHTDYLPEQQALDLLAGCDLLVLPYEPTPESASAAVRMALASGVPVAVTPVAIFEELGDAVARLAGGSPEAIAAGVANLLRDPLRRAQLQRTAAAWLHSIAWPLVSRRLQGVLRGLAETRRAGGSGRACTPDRAPDYL